MIKRVRRRSDLRLRLLDAAEKIVEKEGIEAVTIRKLSGQVGVSRTAPYRHFKDKTDILHALAARGFDRLKDNLENISNDPSTSPLGKLEHFIKVYVEFATGNPAKYRLMFSRDVVSRPPNPELVATARGTFIILSNVIDDCVRKGALKLDNSMALANVAWALFHGLSVLAINRQINLSENSMGTRAIPPEEMGAGGAREGVEDLARYASRILIGNLKQ